MVYYIQMLNSTLNHLFEWPTNIVLNKYKNCKGEGGFSYVFFSQPRTLSAHVLFFFILNCWFSVDSTQYRRYLDLQSLMVWKFYKALSIRRDLAPQTHSVASRDRIRALYHRRPACRYQWYNQYINQATDDAFSVLAYSFPSVGDKSFDQMNCKLFKRFNLTKNNIPTLPRYQDKNNLAKLIPMIFDNVKNMPTMRVP